MVGTNLISLCMSNLFAYLFYYYDMNTFDNNKAILNLKRRNKTHLKTQKEKVYHYAALVILHNITSYIKTRL